MESNVTSIPTIRGTRQATPFKGWPSLDELKQRMKAAGSDDATIAASVASAKKMREGVKKAALDFESHFVGMLINEMKKTVEKDPMFHGGEGERTFDEMLSFEQAKDIVHKSGGFGIARMIEQKMITQFGNGYIPADEIRKVLGGIKADADAPATEMAETPAVAAEPHELDSVTANAGEQLAKAALMNADRISAASNAINMAAARAAYGYAGSSSRE